ncbi:hypothetical protein APHAL10511_007923 [Amanita phalloides]|nr:hypothetical protein APHAL10511_007923 [Amanita phalloides]
MPNTTYYAEECTDAAPDGYDTPRPREFENEHENVAERHLQQDRDYDISKDESDTPDDGDERVQLYNSIDAQQQKIEKQIIFAGLFSASVTVHMFKWLRADDAATAARLLAQVTLGLDASITHDSPVPPLHQISFALNPRSVRITVYRLTSLILCFSTIICGTLCLRWLREHLRRLLLPQEITALNRRFKRKVLTVISLLPVMLQLSALLFLAGILELLWEMNNVVAAVATATVGLTSLIVIPATAALLVQNLFELFTSGREME